jgi:SAM-dependent methyltransferase
VRISKYKPLEEFPGWQRAPAYLEPFIVADSLRAVADIGGGANPLLSQEFVQKHGLDYCVLDVSAAELAKAPPWCRTLEVDITAPDAEFDARTQGLRFDLVFSNMLMEHLRDGRQAHRNIHRMLRPGGLSIHFFPVPNNLPLRVNKWAPERLSLALLRLAQPTRDLKGLHGKFPAYYDLCGNPGPRLTAVFKSLGYEVVEHTGYIGHDYYARLPVLRELEHLARRLLLWLQVPMTSFVLIALRKRADEAVTPRQDRAATA